MKKNKKIWLGCLIATVLTLCIVLYTWCFRKVTYTVKFNTDGAAEITSVTVKKGTTVKRPIDPIKKGYIFIEWQLNDKIYDFSTPINSNIELKAKYQEEFENVETYVVNFETNGGTTIPNQIVVKGEKVIEPMTPIKKGYIFDSWLVDNAQFDFETIINKDTTIIANWKKKNTEEKNKNSNATKSTKKNEEKTTTNNNSVTVTFDTDGGTEIGNAIVTRGQKVVMPNAPTKKGFTFIEWDFNNKKYDFNTPVNNNITLKAKWLKNPTINYTYLTVEKGYPQYEVFIDYASYRPNSDEGNYLSGWELYVTNDSAPGNEMNIDGVGYFLHSNNGNETVRTVTVGYNTTNKYRARVFIDTSEGRVYSDWSNLIAISPKLKAPTLNSQFINVDNGRPTYDVSIDYASYRLNSDEGNYLSGWELYVTNGATNGTEMNIDGVGYFLHSNNGNETIRNVITSFNKTYKYRARVYINTADGKVYSDWSNIMNITPSLKAPVLNNTYLETNNNLSTYDVSIDYISYGYENDNYLSGWELYVTSDEAPGNEMNIDGVGYFLHSDNGKDAIREVVLESNRTNKYRARVYINTSEGKIYSKWSDIMIITGK